MSHSLLKRPSPDASCFLSLEMQRGSVNDDSRRGLDRYPFSPLRWDRQPKCPDPLPYPCTQAAMQPPGLRRKHFSRLSPSAPPPFTARGHISFVSPGGNRRKKPTFLRLYVGMGHSYERKLEA